MAYLLYALLNMCRAHPSREMYQPFARLVLSFQSRMETSRILATVYDTEEALVLAQPLG